MAATRELVFLVLQFLEEERLRDTAHRRCAQTGWFFYCQLLVGRGHE